MKRKFVLAVCLLLFLTGCASKQAASDASSSDPVQTTEPTQAEDYDYFYGQIWEIPVETSSILWASQKEPKLFNLFMTEPVILEVGDNFLIAKGILTNEVFSTAEEITVQYDFSEYEGINLIYAGNCLTEENLTLTPAVPFTMSFLYDNVESILIFPDESFDSIEYPLTKDKFTLELSEEGWEDNFTYNGTITITDNNGNVYQTSHNYSFYYSGSDYTNYQWKISGHDKRIAVRPLE